MEPTRKRYHTKTDWWKDAVIYQIYIRSFADSNGDGIGDLQGIIDKIDYLEELGVDALWLTPIYPSPDRDFGYDIEDYYSIHPQYGTLEDFDRLIEELHRREMKFIMDLVVNHSSDRHRWFRSSEQDPNGPYGDFYIWHPGKNGGPPNNWESFFGGSAWKYSSVRGEYFLHLFSENQVDLNWENPKVREEVYRIMRWWRARGVDGFRMDVINMISKHPDFPDDLRDLVPPAVRGTQYVMNGPRLHDYLREMRSEALNEAEVFSVGECPGAQFEDVVELSKTDRSELDAVMQMELMEVDHGPGGKWDIQRWSPRRLAKIIEKWQTGLEERAWPAVFFSNHDQPRPLSRFGDDIEYRYESATMLATLLFSLTGTAFLYYGDEIGMPNAAYPDIHSYRDIDTLNFYEMQKDRGEDPGRIMERVRYMSRDNARSPMQWDSSGHGGFTTGDPWIPISGSHGEINVEEEERAETENRSSVLGYYKRMLQLRKELPSLRRGSFRIVSTDCTSCVVFTKSLGSEQILVMVNVDPATRTVHLAESGWADLSSPVLGNYHAPHSEEPEEELHTCVLYPYEARIYRL